MENKEKPISTLQDTPMKNKEKTLSTPQDTPQDTLQDTKPCRALDSGSQRRDEPCRIARSDDATGPKPFYRRLPGASNWRGSHRDDPARENQPAKTSVIAELPKAKPWPNNPKGRMTAHEHRLHRLQSPGAFAPPCAMTGSAMATTWSNSPS